MPIPRIIHFTIPAEPTANQQKCIAAAKEMHPDWEIKVWQDPLDPAGFRLGKYWQLVNSGAQLADLVRLEVVYQHGGFYLDSDFQVHRRLDPLCHYSFVVCSEDGMKATNAFFGGEAGSPVIKRLIDSLDEEEIDWKLPPNMTTGPFLFTRELKWRSDVTVVPRETFYPYNFNEKHSEPREWTYATHLWDHSWRDDRSSVRRAAGAIKRWLNKLPRNWVLAYRESTLNKGQIWGTPQPNSYAAIGTICAQTIHGPKMFLVGEDCTVTPAIALNGTYEFREEQFIKRVIRRGDWVIDVGANVGIISLLSALKVGPFGRVFSYEPNPLPAGLLKKSLIINWLHDRTEVRQQAMGAERGQLKLRFSPEVLGGATLAELGSAGTFEASTDLLQASVEIDVEVSTLDTDFPVDLPIRFLKVDAEGFEHQVLRGGARLLERHCIDILMLECVQEVYGAAWQEFLTEIKKLIGYGYEPYVLDRRSKLKRITYNNILLPNRGRNVVFVSKSAQHTIRELA
jgi:FkbM family methyltransferase